MYAASHDLRMVQQVMGHSSPQTTVGYVAYSQQSAHEAAEAIAAEAAPRLAAVPDTPVATGPRQVRPPRLRGALAEGALGDLTARELGVLEQLVLGKTNAAIGQALGLSSETAKTHLSRIRQKLGAPTRAALVAAALRAGLVA